MKEKCSGEAGEKRGSLRVVGRSADESTRWGSSVELPQPITNTTSAGPTPAWEAVWPGHPQLEEWFWASGGWDPYSARLQFPVLKHTYCTSVRCEDQPLVFLGRIPAVIMLILGIGHGLRREEQRLWIWKHFPF